MNMWNTLQECYQQSLYQTTLCTVKCQIQHAENPIPAAEITVEAARVDNAILIDNLSSEAALEQPEIRYTNPLIQIHNNWMDDKLHFGMAGDIGDSINEGDESNECDVIPTGSQRWWSPTQVFRYDLGTSYVDRCWEDDGDHANVDEVEESLQAGHGSMQNIED